MAITIHQQPQLYTPVYNPMRFVILSTNTAQPNFNYVVDVYTSGVAGRSRFLYPADPTTGYAAPDIQGIIESHISYDIVYPTVDFQRCTNSIKAYEVKFGEQYGPSSGVVTYADIAVTGTKYAWNGVLSPREFSNFDYTLYTCGMGSALLTQCPDEQKHYNLDADYAWLYFINDTSGCAYYANINIYDSSNNVLSVCKIENVYQASSSVSDKMLRVGVGTQDILNATHLIHISGNVNYFGQSGYDHYDVTLQTYSGINTSQTITFYRQCSTKYGKPIRLSWLNRLGGFDSFDFSLVRREASDKVTDTFQKNLGVLSGNTWIYSAQDRGTTVYNTSITDKLFAESDLVDSTESAWLQELFESPEVYELNLFGQLIPVEVKQTGYEKKTTKQDKCFNISIQIEYSNKRWTQRG